MSSTARLIGRGLRPRSGIRRAFTLLELMIVLVIVAVLCLIGTGMYSQFVHGADDDVALSNLQTVMTAANAWALDHDVENDLTEDMFRGALDSFPDVVSAGVSAAGSGWTIVGPGVAPAGPHEFSIGFDTGIGTAVTTDHGTRVAVVTRSVTGRFYATLALASPDGRGPQPFNNALSGQDDATGVLTGGGIVSPGAPVSSEQPTATATTSPTASPTVSPTVSPSGVESSSESAGPTGTTTSSAGAPASEPVTEPVGSPASSSPATSSGAPISSNPPSSATPAPITNPPAAVDWTTCGPSTASRPVPTTGRAQIITHGDTGVWWSVTGDTSHVAGYKICAVAGPYLYLLAATGPGTGDARSWVVRTSDAQPGVYLTVVVVNDDGTNVAAGNSCDVRPAGKAVGWGDTC